MSETPGSFGRVTLAGFSESLASSDPVPGGGSASAVVGALAASLVVMVVRLSQDRPRYEPFAATHERAIATAEPSRVRLLELAEEDAAAYAALAAAYKLPKETAQEQEARSERVRAAARTASEVPLRVVRECHHLVREVETLAGRSNLNAASDLEVAALLAQAAARGSAANVLTNLPQVGDERFAGMTTSEVGDHLHDIEAAVARVNQQIAGGGLRSPERE
ncbi:cyclodeaminase/cyclohydrolase family protein [soil metagenome]